MNVKTTANTGATRANRRSVALAAAMAPSQGKIISRWEKKSEPFMEAGSIGIASKMATVKISMLSLGRS